jgi:hypothetical protein
MMPLVFEVEQSAAAAAVRPLGLLGLWRHGGCHATL